MQYKIVDYAKENKQAKKEQKLEARIVKKIEVASEGELLRLRSCFVADIVNGKEVEMSKRLVKMINSRLTDLA